VTWWAWVIVLAAASGDLLGLAVALLSISDDFEEDDWHGD
jgi:hypothetical protein